ncbi:Zinc finger, CCHC-type [Dillenia turbinata]|uniref:Zinc finger, CCHC-type n=1 Tax=Dillenia turbinata TaxID=194707 RepID=A0AAN8VG38_9MAGN
MVLSNKKLKQKLRATLAESLVSTATKIQNPNPNLSNPDSNSQPQSLKHLLISATQKPRLSKREKRRKSLSSESVQTANAFERQRKKEKKKRKRENDEEEGKNRDTQTEAAAKRALALDGADMGGLYLKIVPYKATQVTKESADFSPAIVEGYNRIYVGNLSWDITEDDLRSLFSDCSISSLRWGKDKEKGEFRGYAHVDFNDNVSLKSALMLDQRVVCGRPVRIRCAVPAKKAVEPHPKSVPTSENADAGGTSSKSGKNRRKDCYECGERGHISSECPKKQAADAKSADPYPKSVPASENTDVDGTSSNIGKKNKNRTCYDGGERGHMSSECPKKEVADTKSADPSPESDLTIENADAGQMNSKNGKKNKNRTCYECGERGHISSECPKKETADAE